MRATPFPVRTLLGRTSALILPLRWFLLISLSPFSRLSARDSQIAAECLFLVLHTTGESRHVHFLDATHMTLRLERCLWTQQVRLD